MRRALVIGAVVAVVIIVLIAALIAAGFFQQAVNNGCPPGQCGNNNPPIYFSVTFEGYVVNPSFGTMYATVEANGANNQPLPQAGGRPNGIIILASSAPGLSFIGPKLDFWTNNYEITGTYAITFPSGATYTYHINKIDGSVGGSSWAAWSQVVYQQGPHGTYTVSLTMSYTQTGCSSGCSVSGQVQVSNQATL